MTLFFYESKIDIIHNILNKTINEKYSFYKEKVMV
jgi:hypothetical protein